MTLVLEVTQGPWRGRRLALRLAGHVRVKKAMGLDSALPVVIQVANRRSRAGKSFSSITDFWQVRTWDNMTVLGGMPAGEHVADDLSALHYNVDQEIERLHDDLSCIPDGHTPWAAPLILEEFAYDLWSTLVDSSTTAAISVDDLVEHEGDDGWGSHMRRQIAAEYSHAVLTLADGRQHLVRYDPAFAAYCRLEAPRDTAEVAMVSAFQYDDALAEHMRLHGGMSGEYRSPVWARWVPVKFDVAGDAVETLARCRRFVTALARLSVPSDYVMVFADGSGSLEVMFPSASFAATPRPGFEIVAGYLCLFISDWSVFCSREEPCRSLDEFALPPGCINIDTSAYRTGSQMAMPNTRPSGGENYKVRITTQELFTSSADTLDEITRHPRPFDPPAWRLMPFHMLANMWQFCVAVAVCRSQTVSQVTLANRWIHEKTFDFLRCGAPPEELDARVFMAAMNLCDFRCPEPLMEALLAPVAFACGMPVTRLKRTLANAVKKSRLARPVPIEAPPDAWFTRRAVVDE